MHEHSYPHEREEKMTHRNRLVAAILVGSVALGDTTVTVGCSSDNCNESSDGNKGGEAGEHVWQVSG